MFARQRSPGHELAVAGFVAGNEQVYAVNYGLGVEIGRRGRQLLAHGRGQAGVEREHEGFELPLLDVVDLEHRCREEIEERRDGPVVQESALGHLRSGGIELAELVVAVTKVGHLEFLRLAFEGRKSTGAERQVVAAFAGGDDVVVAGHKKAGAGGLLGGEAAVEIGHRVWRVAYLQDEIGVGLHLLGRKRQGRAHETHKCSVELLEAEVFVERIAAAAVAVAAPVHGAGAVHAPEALRGHRALGGMKGVSAAYDGERVGVGNQLPEGVAEVPGLAVHVGREVTGGAGVVTVSRGERGVVEKAPTVAYVGGFGVVAKGHGAQLTGAAGVHQRYGLVKEVENVEPRVPLVQGYSHGARAHRDAIGHSAGGVYLAHQARTEGRYPGPRARCVEDEVERHAEAVRSFRRRSGAG